MTEGIDNILLEHRKRFQAGQERSERDLREIMTRLSQLELSVAGVRGDIAHSAADQARQQMSFDGMADRVDRADHVKRRLELNV